MIKNMCGTVSFKRGDSFYRGNKVNVTTNSEDRCEATVMGNEDFHVTIVKNDNGGLHTRCSCPKLASFQKDCQHIAAVLFSILENQRKELIDSREHPSILVDDETVTDELLTLFTNTPTQTIRNRFERRKQLDVLFTCKQVTIGNSHVIGISVKIGPVQVRNVRQFLEELNTGKESKLSKLFTYNPALHCFQEETVTVFNLLYQIVADEKAVVESQLSKTDSVLEEFLLIPPSYWNRLLSNLTRAPYVKLDYSGNIFDGIQLSEERLALQFYIEENVNRQGFHLHIKGFDHLVLLQSYESILLDGKVVQLKSDDFKRLLELKRVIDGSKTNSVAIPQEKLSFFIEKVVPGLRKVGEVHLSENISQLLVKTPLIAKLYLDRVNNKLLAGLEFHYENHIIHPLEGREVRNGSLIVRDIEKEDIILQLMEDSDFVKTDGGYFLQNEELEYEFLYHVVPKLQKFVQLYATTAVRNRIFRENARPKIRVKMKTERTNWLEFKFELEGIPDEHIRDVLQAIEEKRKYYRLRNGSLLSLETREFEEIQRFLKAGPIQNEDIESGVYVPVVQGLQLLDTADRSEIFTIEQSFREFLENIRTPEEQEFEIPKILENTLRDYQIKGFKWMKLLSSYGFGGILADDMGLGKTLQAISFLVSELPLIRNRKHPALVVCPSSLTYNWLNELLTFAPDVQAIVVDGDKKERREIQKDFEQMDVIITSYPLLLRDIDWFEKQIFHSVIFDEAQAFKNPATQTARAVKKINADHRFALTGTPVENSLEELWSIFHVVLPELFGGIKEYSNLQRETIARRIKPFMLRRLKEDVVLELPQKIESMDAMELHTEQKKLYAAYLAKLRHDTLKHLDKDTLRKNRIKILAGITRLRQICCHPALFVDGYKGGSAKFDQLMKLIEECRLSGRRVLIFSQFTKMLQLIKRELTYEGQSFFYLDGQTPSEERVELCNRFNKGEHDLFLISLKAGGTGLNLTGADTVILYDIWWNPAVEEQAADRAHRIGQTKDVHVIKLVSKGTIEEKMNELQDKKRHLIEEVIEEVDRISTSLTDEDIKDLLMIN
jgi:SNF2 family DNA or RNA helicase